MLPLIYACMLALVLEDARNRRTEYTFMIHVVRVEM